MIATKEDHWFLLFNILRCPNGVGTWAAAFLQVPCKNGNCSTSSTAGSPSGTHPTELPMQLDSPEISHCIAVLQILMLPIKKRCEYLKEFNQFPKDIVDPIRDECWILIDSDGEDSQTPEGDFVGPKENDLISLLNQIPLEKLFASALSIEKFLNDYIIEPDIISANQMIKVIAFFSKLVAIFGEGMITYNTERYKQLAKRLGRLVRHTLQYVADYHHLFICNNLSKDPFLCERIAVELNVLLVKACSYIYRTRNLAIWQFFSSLPFTTMETSTVWQIFYYLNVGFPTDFPVPVEDFNESFNRSDFLTKFNVANVDSSPEDLYYLLQAFFEMANGRDKMKDWDLIKGISLHIFNIGFINEKTREVCYKTARDMLLNLTICYEDLISCLLLQLKIRFNEIDKSAYLFKSLPLENWKPGMDSFEVLSNWLLNYDFKSAENMLSRIVISHLNWGFDREDSERLFLPHNIHVRMACLVSEALTKHSAEVVGNGSLSETVRQVTNLLDYSLSPKEQFSSWCWNMANILHLHLMDQNTESIKNTLQNPTEPLLFIPDLERIDIIYQGVTEQRPLAIYISILVSLWGHSIPLICQKGFELLKLLLTDYRHAAVIRCLELLVPLFLDTPETLANCENFQVILMNLINADKTYLKMAKEIIYADLVGPILEMLDNMIHCQITNYTHYGLVTPLNLINIWLNCLTNLPNWQQTSVVYLLNKVLRIAYQFPDARFQAVEYFRYYYKDCLDWKTPSKTSSIKTFFGSNSSRIPVLSPSHGWLALVLLEIEYRAQDSHFWPELLRQLISANSNAKGNLESVFKKTANIMKISAFSPTMLVIYKYANLIANMDVSSPIFPIMTQKFFELFLSRVTLQYNEEKFQETFGASDKFYEYNVPLMKKIKANIKSAENFYTSQAEKNASDEALSYFYRNCARIMKTFQLWLEETSINKMTIEQQNLPPQYNVNKLQEIFNGNTNHWTEFLHLPSIRKSQREQADHWARKCFRLESSKHLRKPLQRKQKTTPIQRIKNNLCSYDKPLDAPKYYQPAEKSSKEITKTTLRMLTNNMQILNSTVNKLGSQTSQLKSLNRSYLAMVVNLYKMVPYKDIKMKNCTSLVFNRTCSSPARIVATMEHIRKNDEIDKKILEYRGHHDKIINALLAMNVEDFAQSTELLRSVVKCLSTAQVSNSNKSNIITSTGTTFFYNVIEHMTDAILEFRPTREYCTRTLNDLGVFIQDNQEKEGPIILELILKRPQLLKFLTAVFVPSRTSPQSFLKMYKIIVDSYLKRCDSKVLFVLLSKFEMIVWLETFHPKLYDINQLLQLVLTGLECWSQKDSSLLQDVYRRHLVHIFEYDFPQHYGEVMQMVLDRISEKRLMPVVLLDLLNALLARFNCGTFNEETTAEQIREFSEDFARKQNIFTLKAATDTVMLFARHFQKERLQHGLHGLYPKHVDYCRPLSMWFSCFGHIIVVASICTYQELLADQISDIIFGSIIDMYAPWLICYSEQTLQQEAANWIRQLTEHGKMLLPWSEAHAKTSKIIIQPFINTLLFILNSLPVSSKVLHHTFAWYIHHFAVPNLASYIQSPIHEGIAQLQWELFKPHSNHIDMLHDTLESFLPESHAMLGHIFIRINWNAWISEVLPSWPQTMQHHSVSRLLSVFVKISFEPNIHTHTNTSRILEEAIAYPWHIVDSANLENLLKWFISSVEPSITLKLPTESNYADRAVLDLLRLAAAMMPERSSSILVKDGAAKRILYTRAWVRMLRSCASKNHKLLATKDGLNAYNSAFIELINTMDNCIRAISNNRTTPEAQREAVCLMIEILAPMQTQSEETTNLHIDLLIHWQAQCAAGDLLCCATLEAVGHMKGFTSGFYALIEATIAHYFKYSEETKDWHNPTWASLLQILKISLEKLELMPIMNGPYFFTLHIYILYKLEKLPSLGEQIIFLQDLSQLVENLKTSEHTEPRMAIVWGIIISRGVKILTVSENAKKPLLMLARQLHILSTKAESWGDGLLGVIGLKRDVISNKRKVLTRCLSCIIFSLFPDTSTSYFSKDDTTATAQTQSKELLDAMHELTTLLANKKFLNVKPLIVSAIGILKDNQSPTLCNIPHLICRIIGLFYDSQFLLTIPEVWEFDYKLF